MPRKLFLRLLRRLEASPLRAADRVRLDLERELVDQAVRTPAERSLRLGFVVARLTTREHQGVG